MEILIYPEPDLKRVAEDIDEIDDALIKIAEEMCKLMYESDGVGLAGNQVGLLKRIITVNVTGKREDEIILLNPTIEEAEGEVSEEEGCLSFPGILGTVVRSEKVLVKGLDIQGSEIEVEGDELLARVLQHEIDHLDGILFISKLPPAEKQVLSSKIKALKSKKK